MLREKKCNNQNYLKWLGFGAAVIHNRRVCCIAINYFKLIWINLIMLNRVELFFSSNIYSKPYTLTKLI